MGRKVTVTLVDDLTGEEEDVQTVEFGLDGVSYEIDLGRKNAEELRSILSRHAAAGRRRPRRAGTRGTGRRVSAPAPRSGRRAASTDREQNRAIRDWARKRGITVSQRGRIPNEVVERYHRER